MHINIVKLGMLSMLVAACLSSTTSCKTIHDVQKTTAYDSVVIEHRVYYDTIQVQVKDSSTIVGHDAVQQLSFEEASRYAKLLDSLQVRQALQDKRILALLSKLVNKDMHLDPVKTEVGYANAEAGVDNNKLWLKLNVDSVGVLAKHTEQSVHTKQTEKSEHTETIQEQPSILRNLCLLLVCLLCIICLLCMLRRFLK